MGVTPIAVYARPPRPGEAKTRLTPVLGANGASELYACFVSDTIRVASGVTESVSIWSSRPDDGSLAALTPGLPMREQRGHDLGTRMAHTLETLVSKAGAALLIGTDTPTLPASYLRLAEAAFDENDVVFGPAADGGYYLVGARGAVPAVFDGIAWSTPTVLADTLAACRKAGLAAALLPPWYDVDTPDDLRILRAHLSVEPHAAPATSRSLGLL